MRVQSGSVMRVVVTVSLLIGAVIGLFVLDQVITIGTLIYPSINPDSGFGWIDAVAFSPDSRTLASGSKLVKLWDASSGSVIRKFSSPYSIKSLAFSPNGGILAGGDEQSTVILWDLASGHESKLPPSETHFGWINVAFSPDGSILASSGYNDGTIKLWDPKSGAQIRALNAFPKKISSFKSFAFSPKGHILASAGGDGTIKFWDAISGCEIRSFPADRDTELLAFSPDGRLLAAANPSFGSITILDPFTGRQINTLRMQGFKHLKSLAFSPDGRILASGGDTNVIELWDPFSGRQIRTLNQQADVIQSLAFSLNGHMLASAGGDKTIKLWNPVSGHEIRTLSQCSPIDKLFKWIAWQNLRHFSPD